jgi:hypothetical protein
MLPDLCISADLDPALTGYAPQMNVCRNSSTSQRYMERCNPKAIYQNDSSPLRELGAKYGLSDRATAKAQPINPQNRITLGRGLPSYGQSNSDPRKIIISLHCSTWWLRMR